MSEKVRAQQRRPLEPVEVGHLVRFGRALAELRRQAGLSQAELAWKASTTETHVGRLERGERRTRASTLDHIALALVQSCPALGDPAALLDDLCALLGPALAAPTRREGKSAREIERRRRQRAERLKGWVAAEVEALANEKAEAIARGWCAEWAATGRAPWLPPLAAKRRDAAQ